MDTIDTMDNFAPYLVHSTHTIDTMDARTHCGLFPRFSYTEEVAPLLALEVLTGARAAKPGGTPVRDGRSQFAPDSHTGVRPGGTGGAEEFLHTPR